MKIRLPYLMACAAVASLLVLPAHANKDDEEKEKRAPTAAQSTQQNKMKTCNAEAGKKELKGDERRAFMSACLKG
jgi:hypothetical protein